MKLEPTTPLNDALRYLANGNCAAASVLGLLIRDFPHTARAHMDALGELNVRGADIANRFWKTNHGDIGEFIMDISTACENGQRKP